MSGLRWFRFKEGFSTRLVCLLLAEPEAGHVLDPFTAIDTTPLTACGMGLRGTGIELMPVCPWDCWRHKASQCRCRHYCPA